MKLLPKVSLSQPSQSPHFSIYTATPIGLTVTQLRSHSQNGLSSDEASRRSHQVGLNQINSANTSWWHILVRQFKSPFIYLLLGATALTLGLGEFTDASFILFFIVLNAVLGFFQEFHSEQAIKVLKSYSATSAKVIREGRELLLDTKFIVPGDVVLLQPGDIIPADIQFIDCSNLVIDESMLSGESRPVTKTHKHLPEPTSQVFNAINLGFSGTHVISGLGRGIVIGTGKQAYIGTIAELTTETVRTSSFEKGMGKFSTFVLRLVMLTLSAVIVANLIIKGNNTNIFELVVFSIALATAVIPEGLPLVMTFSLSRGAVKLANNKVIVKRLSAIEDLGGIEVLCTDKTGTITENKLSVADILGKDRRLVLSLAAMAIPQQQAGQKTYDPFDIAITKALKKVVKIKLPDFSVLEEIPFNPNRRSNSVLVKRPRMRQIIIRGAAEALLPKCKSITTMQLDTIKIWLDSAGKKGLRTLTVVVKNFTKDSYTYSDERSNFEFVGIIAFTDPLKKSTKQAISHAKKLGVQVKILTGDSAAVAAAVGREIGLIPDVTAVMTGDEFDRLSLSKKERVVQDFQVFARLNPEQKYTIIKLIEKTKEVGFLGEGINDAPALKSANVALVVQHASDIAKESADIILLNPSLEVIINGIQEGRKVFANTIKYVKLTLASNLGNFYAIAIASLIVDYLPMLPIQILFVNLLTDLPLVSIATDSVEASEIKTPETYNLKDFALFSTTLGLVSTVFDFMFFGSFYRISESVLQTNWLIGSVLTELVLIFSLHSRMPIFRSGLPSRQILTLSLLACIAVVVVPFTSIGQGMFRLTPPTFGHLSLIFLLVGGYFASSETVKYFYYKFLPDVR